jgi:aminobenzoyl-glutamate utilization protein A
MTTNDLGSTIAAWRREFHRYPELGFLEYRTAARVCSELSQLPGCLLRVGKDVMVPEARMNTPTPQEYAQAKDEACALGADPKWVERFGDGLTGVVAEWRFPEPGPTIAFRFDMDALPVNESTDLEHRPNREGFASVFPGRMHACGHDAHTAMGLGLASLVPAMSGHWRGTLRLIFQPAEEGCRGAKAMVAAGVMDDVDWLICGHVGVGANRTGLVICGTQGMLATIKFEVRFKGMSAHAGLEPHRGRNALLAAATCALQLHALPRHGEGTSRVNVGVLQSGTTANVVPGEALLKFEVRGATTAINEFMAEEARRVVRAATDMYGVTSEIRIMGEAAGAHCDTEMMQVVREAAAKVKGVEEIGDVMTTLGSEDATLLMEAVQSRGGRGTYLLVGSQMPAGHHQSTFDLDDLAMTIGVELYVAITDRLLSTKLSGDFS